MTKATTSLLFFVWGITRYIARLPTTSDSFFLLLLPLCVSGPTAVVSEFFLLLASGAYD